jgi:hypothetical protein
LSRAAAGTASLDAVPAIVGEVLRSPGQPLGAPMRAFMESRFGHDFSRIRVHTDAQAGAAARAVDARAYTVGHDIVFASGHYSPRSPAGLTLLAHELAHTIQQRAAAPAGVGRLDLSDPTEQSEHEAHTAAQAVTRGGSAGAVGHVATASIQRAPADSGASRPGPEGGPGTLPFRQATELSKCLQIMGDANRDYCREQVLGEKPPARCPTTHRIPDDVYAGIDAAWRQSGHGGATVAEHGGRIVSDRGGRRVIRTGAGGGGSISLPAAQPGDVTLGTFHTHPYSAAEGSELGVGFSGGDITNFIAGNQGSVKYIGAGSCDFVLDTVDFSDRDACQKIDTTKRWNDAFAAATGAFQAKVETAVKATILGCGLCFYKTCLPDDHSPVPKDASPA